MSIFVFFEKEKKLKENRIDQMKKIKFFVRKLWTNLKL